MSDVGMHNRMFCAYAYSTMLCIDFAHIAHMTVVPYIHTVKSG